MPGAFEASAECNHDALKTAEEIQLSGQETLTWLEAVAESESQRRVDVHLVREIHRRWFESTFPLDAGRERTEMVLNRKDTAVEVDAILPAVADACETWTWRQQHAAPGDEAALVGFIVAEANTVAVRIYDVHPFLDGNTRTTWHLRNYLLMLGGLRPLIELTDGARYEEAWWAATPLDHALLDEAVVDELSAEDRV